MFGRTNQIMSKLVIFHYVKSTAYPTYPSKILFVKGKPNLSSSVWVSAVKFEMERLCGRIVPTLYTAKYLRYL